MKLFGGNRRGYGLSALAVILPFAIYSCKSPLTQSKDGIITASRLADDIPVSKFTNYVANGGQPGAVVIGPSDTNSLTLQTGTSFTVNTNGSSRMIVDSSGNIIVNGTTTTAQVEVDKSFTGYAAQNYYNLYLGSTLNPAGVTVANTKYFGIYNNMVYNGSATVTNSYPAINISNNNSNGTISTSFGSSSETLNSSTGTITEGIGAYNLTQNSSSGVLTTGYGTYGALTNAAGGTMTSGTGVYGIGSNTGAGSITSANGVQGSVVNSGAGTITTAAAGSFSVTNSGGGANTTAYGVYIGTVAGTTKYSLYASDSSANSYFAGKIGIGTSSPSAPIHVYNAGGAGTGIRLESTSSATYAAIDASTSGTILFSPDGGTTVASLSAAGAWTNASDIRFKRNIYAMSSYGLDTVLKLRPVEYTMKSNDAKSLGFIAQEMQALIPEVVEKTAGDYLGIAYGNLTAVLAKAIQQLYELFKTESENTNRKLASLENRLTALEQQNKAKEADLNAVKAQNTYLMGIICQEHPNRTECKP